ncbi:MAG: tyrosine-type recombinase/integrase [Flavobacteriales bacterium]|nr:tyrosine-type recombinase/integrase [Flavobacteriales bacterium]
MYIIISLNSGLRIGDVLRIRWSDLQGDKLMLQEQKTKKHRTIQVNDNIKKALSYFEEQGDEHIFKSQKGSVYSVQQINRLLKQVFAREAKSHNISSHSLRKSMGRRTWEVYNESEKALIYLSELFQHSSTSITRKYLGLRDEELQDVYMRL